MERTLAILPDNAHPHRLSLRGGFVQYRRPGLPPWTARATAKVDVGTVSAIFVTAQPAPQNVDILAMIRAGDTSDANGNLVVAIFVSGFGRPPRSRAQWTRGGHGGRCATAEGLAGTGAGGGAN